MPIYEYKCQNCGNHLEVLQKFSDKPLTDCPECGQGALKKQVSATSFRLKGSGWYVTDFKDSGKKAGKDAEKDKKVKNKDKDKPAAEKKTDKPSKTGKDEDKK